MTTDFYGDLAKSIITLLVVIGTIASVPVIMTLTSKMETRQRTSISNLIIVTVAALLFVFAFIGNTIFSIFGISILE